MNDLELYCDPMTNMGAQVCARLRRRDDGDWRILGQVHGPRCRFTRTLAATFELRAHDGIDWLLASASVVDPCFWSPELPFLYEAHVELRHGEELVDVTQRPLAIRPLSVHRKNLLYANRRWVLRAVARSTSPASPMEAWREGGAAMLVNNPDAALAKSAAELGVLLIVPIAETDPQQIANELRRLARWPAVGFAAIDASVKIDQSFRQASPNLILAAHAHFGDPPATALSWADVFLYESNDLESIGRFAAACPRPVIAYRSSRDISDVTAARAACDRLQRDLAPQADLTGYIV